MFLKLLLPAVLLCSSVFAVEAPKVEAKQEPVQLAGYNFVGISLGVSKPASANINTPLRFGFGAEVTHALSKEFAVGGFISRGNGPAIKNSIVDYGITQLGGEAVYNPTHDSFFDLRAGIGFLDAKATIGGTTISASSSTHPIFVGPGFGLIVPIMPKLQLAPSLHYVHFFSNSEVDAFEVFDVMATIRYQF